jgi:hypothetical protein
VVSARTFSTFQDEATSTDAYSESGVRGGRTPSQPAAGCGGGTVAQDSRSNEHSERAGRSRSA